MSRIKNFLSESINITYIISIGFFAKAVPKEKIDAVLERLGKQSKESDYSRHAPSCIS